MRRTHSHSTKRLQNANVARSTRHRFPGWKRVRGGQRNERLPFSPPEDWYEPSETPAEDPYDFKIVVQPAGKGFQHVLTPAEIRSRLRQLPPEMVAPLEVVQLSRMTRKKERFACYGMQWGNSVYLYPVEENRVESHCRPPTPAQRNEARMYGGRWVQKGRKSWKLIWSEEAVKDYYMNNILIHELGHILDERNSGYNDRERFAEWFALEYGYKQSLRLDSSLRRRKVRRQHG